MSGALTDSAVACDTQRRLMSLRSEFSWLMSLERRSSGLLALILASVSLPLLVAQSAQAEYYPGDDWTPLTFAYSVSSDNCSGPPVDPIGIVLFGDGITAQNQQEMVQYHTGWSPGDTAATQATFSSASAGCDPMDVDNISNCGTCTRFHVRLNYVGHPIYSAVAAGRRVSTSQGVVAGTPHFEAQVDDCRSGTFGIGTGGHRTIDYAGARDLIVVQMSVEHPHEEAWYGNTYPITQCPDGTPSSARGDGRVEYIYSFPFSSTTN